MPDWHNYIKVHPAANLFPLISTDERVEFVADIRENGLRIPVVTYTEAGTTYLLDGRNRLDALEASGGDVMAALANAQNFTAPEHNPWELVVGYNIHRRHLTSEQKRAIIAQLLQAEPERSNTDTARLAHVDPKTVGAVRAKVEAEGKIPRVTHTVGHDGRIRTATPAPRAKRTPAPPAPPRSSVPPSQARDNGAVAVSALLTRDVAEGLADIIHAISGHTGRIEHVDRKKREELVDRFATALALTAPSRAVEAARAVPTSYDKQHCSFCGDPVDPGEHTLIIGKEAGICAGCAQTVYEKARKLSAPTSEPITEPVRARRRRVKQTIEEVERNAAFGRKVFDERKARGLTQSVLANRLGMNQMMLSRIETGRATAPPELAARLAAHLGFDPAPAAEPMRSGDQPDPAA